MKEIKRCPTCKAKMVEYRHSLTKNMVACLFIALENGGTIPFLKIGKKMTFNQASNFQKLKYWDLIVKVRGEDGSRVGGLWAITEFGKDFLLGNTGVMKSVWTYRNEVVRYDGPSVKIQNIGYEPYRTREDYIEDERPKFIDNKGQFEFF